MASDLTIVLGTISLLLLSIGLTLKWQERRAELTDDNVVGARDE